MRKPRKITPRQERFCLEYMYGPNAKQAMKRAGYGMSKGVGNYFRLLQMPVVQARLQELREELEETHRLNRNLLIRELTLVAFSDIRDYLDENNEVVNINKLEPAKARAIASIRPFDKKTKGVMGRAVIKLHDKIEALSLLAKILGVYDEDQKRPEDFVKQIIIVPASMDQETINKKLAELPEGGE